MWEGVELTLDALGTMEPTPTLSKLPLRKADFSTLAEALDYAAQGETGCNFYSGGGKLCEALPYSVLRMEARQLARRLQNLGCERGERVALVADTDPDFIRFFFACQYAALVPVPLPASVRLGGHHAYVQQLTKLLEICQASVAVAPASFLPFLKEAAEEVRLRFLGSPADFRELAEDTQDLPISRPEDVAYLQYTSGSTRFPRGVVITQKAVLSNLSDIIEHGVGVRTGDRSVSWLPFYHDMGLVGLVLSPLASQMSVDYLSTRDFAMRPRQWLAIMSRNRATMSISPPFGYELCARRLRREETDQFDLSAWRMAGVGAETIRREPLEQFARILAPSGFDRKAFVACYGMAECSLAVSFAPLGKGLEVDRVDGDHLAATQEAVQMGNVGKDGSPRMSHFIKCGVPLPGFEVEVRGKDGVPLPERHCGTLFVKGPSVMVGYFEDPTATSDVLSEDGWLDTGDLGYRVGNSLIITGREKDLIIINGRNIWPQDLEYLAEQQPEVRTGDASAFSVSSPNGEERAVLVIECRESDPHGRSELSERLRSLVYQDLGIDCFVELVPRNTLPRTTSGKLSRSGARSDFLKRASGRQVMFIQSESGQGSFAKKAI
jgi:fatty-acyl-CoA synthase